MSYKEIMHIEIGCDYPGCDEYLLFGHEEWKDINKMSRAIGWTHISFPGESKDGPDEGLSFCSNCKNKELPVKEKHVCVYMRKTKKGKVSYYGSILECYFCWKIKGVQGRKIINGIHKND